MRMNASPRWATMLLPVALFTACGDDDESTATPDAGAADSGRTGGGEVPTQNLVQRAQQEGLTSLVQALVTADLGEVLADDGPFTLFAPDEDAFSALEAAPTDRGLLGNLLLYHVLPFESDSTAIVTQSSLRTSAAVQLPVDASLSPPTVGGVALGQTDIRATNGVIHVLGSVLTPPDIAETIDDLPQTTTLSDTIANASGSVQSAFAAAGPITVFAPVNEAFTRIDADLLADPEIRDDLLQYGISTAGQVLAGDFTNGQSITMANGQALNVTVGSGGEIILADAQNRTVRVVQSDIRLRNGVLHLVDRVPLPSRAAGNVLETLRRNNLGTLDTSIMTANLTDTLSSPGPFTIFAPTDTAFAAAAAALPSDPDLLGNVLVNHVVGGSFTTQQLSLLSSLTGVGGLDILLDFAVDPPTVGVARLGNTTDQIATNGVVHSIDRVLVPPNVLEGTVLVPTLSTLRAAVLASPATEATLGGAGPITVFAPVDAAFEGVDLAPILGDQLILDDLLGYHLANGQALSTSLTDGEVITMSTGTQLTVRVEGSAVTLQDGAGQTINVVAPDIRLLNGVVHLVDGVLNPDHLLREALDASLTRGLNLINRAQLTATFIQDPGPFTVFLPTNDAFAALEAAVNADPDIRNFSLDIVQPTILANILFHHTVPERLTSADVIAANGTTAFTNLSGLPLAVGTSTTTGGLTVGGADLGTELDGMAVNGILHTVNQVIVPPTVLDVAQATPDLSTLVTAVGRASGAVVDELTPQVLTVDRPITVFAPVNSAFANQGIDPSTLDAAALDPILGHHVVRRQQLTSDVFPVGSTPIDTVNGRLTVVVDIGGQIMVNDESGNTANVIATDIRTLDGVVHLIDRVLIPN